MSIDAKLDRLIAAMETLAGAVIANANALQSAQAAAAAFSQAAAPAAAPAAPVSAQLAPAAEQPQSAGASGPGRPRTVFYRLSDGSVVKQTSRDPVPDGAQPATKAEYEAAQEQAAPAAAAAPSAPAAEEAPAVAAPTELTIDDARNAALAIRDKFGLDRAKEVIKGFGIEKVGDLKPEQIGAFLKVCADALNPTDEL